MSGTDDLLSKPRHRSITWSPTVNFCIWVLEEDGMLVPPFSQHTGGDGRLQALGMTDEIWNSWLSRVAALLDVRLMWHTENIQAQVDFRVEQQRRVLKKFIDGYSQYLEQNVGDTPNWENDYSKYWESSIGGTSNLENELEPIKFRGMGVEPLNDEDRAAIENLLILSSERVPELTDRPENRLQIEEQILWRENQYQLALNSAHQVFGDLDIASLPKEDPVELWIGSQEAKELLNKLWKRYQKSSIFSQHTKQASTCTEKNLNRAWEQLDLQYSQIDVLCLYTVAYSARVEYVTHSSVAILAMTGEPSETETLEARIIDVARRLLSTK